MFLSLGSMGSNHFSYLVKRFPKNGDQLGVIGQISPENDSVEDDVITQNVELEGW